ncbi:MAG: chloride channel protein [Chloroflexi bacterium]|nr:chloride channel protein [Chloroflexota bacterium]
MTSSTLATRLRTLPSTAAARFWTSETAVMTTLAVIVGASTGLGIAVFRKLLDGLFALSVTGLGGAFPLALVFIPAAGGLLVAFWMAVASRDGETGLGVAGIMEAVALHSGRISLRGSISRIVGAILTVGTGGSAGPEDPSVQIGATIGSQVGQRLYFSESRVKTLVGCGAAAGIGAAFNAPISGVFFAIEIILGEFSGAAIGLVVLSAVAGAVVIQSLLGSSPAFLVPAYEFHNSTELLLYALLGLASAFVALAYIRILNHLEDFFQAWRIPNWIKPAVGGLAVGLLAYFIRPEILGTGYPAIGSVLGNTLRDPVILFALVGLKLLATPLTIGSGGQGGLFAPSLFLGAMLGVGFGTVCQFVFPNLEAPPPAYGLVGMGAVLAATVRAPITAIMLPFEMTQDYRIILPLMFATVVSTVLAQQLERESIYTFKLKLRGIDVRARRDVDLMRSILVEEAMTPVEELKVVKPATPVSELARMFQETSHHGFVVIDDAGELFGVVTLSDLERALDAGSTGAAVGEICTQKVVTAFPDESLDDALRHFGGMDVGRIPIVDRRHPRHVLGILGRSNIVHAYTHALTEKHLRDHHLARLRLEAATGAHLVEVDLKDGDKVVGKRLREIELPAEYVVVSIRRGGRVVVPRGNTQLIAGDRVILLARGSDDDSVRRLFHGDAGGAPRAEE